VVVTPGPTGSVGSKVALRWRSVSNVDGVVGEDER